MQALAQRLDRYRDVPLAVFLKAFDKTDVKMQAFAGEIATLSRSIGYVKKNPHQVVIGLAKTGKPATEALGAYHKGVRKTGAPDVAVTLARNADALGGADHVTERLHEAVGLLQRAGYPRTPVTFGAAKTLLPFTPLSLGVQRFDAIHALVGRQLPVGRQAEQAIKATARLMPADGAPADVVRRAALAINALGRERSPVRAGDETFVGVALGAMVRADEQVAPLVTRYRAVEAELVRFRLSDESHAQGDALECVACPGTPTEVADTVHTLAQQVAAQNGRPLGREDVAIAVAFAKRFAY
jgi:hypothetical protein